MMRTAAAAQRKEVSQTTRSAGTANIAFRVDTPICGDFADFANFADFVDGAYSADREAVSDVVSIANNIDDKVGVEERILQTKWTALTVRSVGKLRRAWPVRTT